MAWEHCNLSLFCWIIALFLSKEVRCWFTVSSAVKMVLKWQEKFGIKIKLTCFNFQRKGALVLKSRNQQNIFHSLTFIITSCTFNSLLILGKYVDYLDSSLYLHEIKEIISMFNLHPSNKYLLLVALKYVCAIEWTSKYNQNLFSCWFSTWEVPL